MPGTRNLYPKRLTYQQTLFRPLRTSKQVVADSNLWHKVEVEKLENEPLPADLWK